MTAARRIAILTILFVAGSTQWPAAQTGSQSTTAPRAPQGGLTFRVESNYVEVDAVVTDASGNFIRDLKSTDFDVREDNRPQAVDVFTLIDIPFEHTDPPVTRVTDAEPDVATNTKKFDGRVYLIVLDSFHVDVARTAAVKQQARQFIAQSLGANDLAAVVHVGDPAAGQEFTTSRQLLSAAVDRFVGKKLRSSALNKVSDATAKEGLATKLGADVAPIRDPDTAARAAQARQALDSVARLSDYMAGIRGRRKAVLLFSEGIDFNTDDTLGAMPSATSDIRSNIESRDAPEVLEAEREMIGAATRANVSLYTIDPRGVASPDDVTIMAGGAPGASDGMAPEPASKDAADEIFRGQNTLRIFAEQTGGLAQVGSNNFTGAFAKIVQDNSSYYVLGYYAPAARRDGKFHTLNVTVKRPGLQVRARKGYYASKEGSPVPSVDVLRDLLASPMPMSGLPMRVVAEVVKGKADKAHVYLTVEVEGHDLPFEQKNGSFTNKLELSYAAFDLAANPQASGRKTMDLTFNPQSRKAVSDNGLRLTTEFDIAPGRYQLRLAGHETLGGATGSVFRDLNVPDFTKGPLAMSDLVLTSSSAAAWPTTNDAAALKDALPGPATAEREFVLEATMAVLVEVYDNDRAHPHTVDLSATVRTHDGMQVFATRDSRESQTASADRGAYTYLARIPLSDLVPGRFILSVQAVSREGGDPVTKEIQFSIK